MPDGVVQWFDSSTGEGRIVHRGRHYTVRAEDMDPKARRTGARVHFDCRREPADRAVDVTLRAGSRVNWHHRRFGDLSGSRAPDEAGGLPSMTRHTELGRRLEQYPMRVAELWASFLADGELENLSRLYAPDASVHADGDVLIGPDRIRKYWSNSPLLGGIRARVVGDEDGMMLLDWPGDGGPTTGSRMWVDHGEVSEQWVGDIAETTLTPEHGDETPIVMSSSGRVTPAEWNYAIDKVGKVLDTCEGPVLFASVRLDRAADPARERGAVARATIDLDGDPVRAHVAASTMLEAIDRLEARLLDRLRHVAAHRRALRRRGAEHPPGQWRHGDVGTPRAPFFPRPVDERQVVRHKTFAPADASIDEAIFDMESMDYDFFLFAEIESGQDAVVWREGDGYRVRFLDGVVDTGKEQPYAAAVEFAPEAAPTLSVAEARDLLDEGGAPWVFFRDDASGRGRLAYRRYDGHYGLITPADES